MAGSRDQRTQFWKRVIQIPFHQSLVAIGPVVSEEKIKVYDVQQTPSDGKSSGELKKGGGYCTCLVRVLVRIPIFENIRKY